MSLDEREKEKLAKRIAEQRRAVWKGEVTPKVRTRKSQELKDTEQTLDSQHEHKEVRRTPEKQQEREKRDLVDKIVEQRRATWKGRAIPKDRPEKKQDYENTRQTWKRNNVQRSSGPRQKSKKTRKALVRQQESEKTEQVSHAPSKVPALKVALLVIIGLIAAIMIGVAVGYLAAVRDLIKI